jgi:hypothetical protein
MSKKIKHYIFRLRNYLNIQRKKVAMILHLGQRVTMGGISRIRDLGQGNNHQVQPYVLGMCPFRALPIISHEANIIMKLNICISQGVGQGVGGGG